MGQKARTTKGAAWMAAVAGFVAVAGSGAEAGLAPDLRCHVGKLKATAGYATCRLKADAKAVSQGGTPDFSRCLERFQAAFPKLEAQAGAGICPSEGDTAPIGGLAEDFEEAAAILLAGGALGTATCGDGSVDPGEDCDDGDLDGKTCATQGFYNGTLLCGPGCSFDTSQCHATRFEDTGNTVLDHETGLEWEKKTALDGVANAADLHDADNTYSWAVSGASTNTLRTGTLFTTFLDGLNGVTDTPTVTTLGCFDGACDWRIPTIDELKGIAVAGCGTAPCVVDAALLPAKSGRHWSISTRSGAPVGAWFLEFLSGATAGDLKTVAYHVRAVRSAR